VGSPLELRDNYASLSVLWFFIQVITLIDTMHQYLGVPEMIPLPLYHTKLIDVCKPELSVTVIVDTQDIINKLKRDREKAFKRVPRIRRNRIVLKFGWMNEKIFEEIIAKSLKHILGEKYKERNKYNCRYIYIFNLIHLEFLLGDKWWSQTLMLRGCKNEEVDGYVFVNDLCGVVIRWSIITEKLQITLPIRYVNHIGMRQLSPEG